MTSSYGKQDERWFPALRYVLGLSGEDYPPLRRDRIEDWIFCETLNEVKGAFQTSLFASNKRPDRRLPSVGVIYRILRDHAGFVEVLEHGEDTPELAFSYVDWSLPSHELTIGRQGGVKINAVNITRELLVYQSLAIVK